VLVFLSKASRAAAVSAATKCLRQKKRDLDAKQKAAQAAAAADSPSPSSPTKEAQSLTLTARESLDACRSCTFAENDVDEFDPVLFFGCARRFKVSSYHSSSVYALRWHSKKSILISQ
jgi:hypothetical protein